MHVLITADTLGGVWTYVRELVTGLIRREVRVTLISFGRIPTPQQTNWMSDLPALDYRATEFLLEWMQDAEADFAVSSSYLASVVHDVSPDVVHLNQFGYGSLKLDVPKVVVAHSDVVSWWIAVHGTEPPESAWIRWYRETVQKGRQQADVVVAPSHSMLDAIPLYCVRPKRTQVIHNGRSPGLFNPDVRKQDYIVSVGRLWDEAKQSSLLTQLASPAHPIYLVGSDLHPDDLQRRRLHQQGTGGVHLRGEMGEGELRQLYSGAAIYAATSRYEPFGLAPLEAALSRCALVMNDISTFRELWGDNACYFRHNEARSLEKTIANLAGDAELRHRYGNRAYEHARRQFNAERMVNEYLCLYQSLVQVEASAA